MLWLLGFVLAVHAVPYPQNVTSTTISPTSVAAAPAITDQPIQPATTLWTSDGITVTPFVICLPDGGQNCDRSGQPMYSFQTAEYGGTVNPFNFRQYQMFNLSNSQTSVINKCAESFERSWEGYWNTGSITFGSLISASTWFETQPARTDTYTEYKVISTTLSPLTESWSQEATLGAPGAFDTVMGLSTDSQGYVHSASVAVVWTVTTETAYNPVVAPTPTTITTTIAAISQPADIFNAYYPAFYASSFSFSIEGECCLMCTLYGGTVQVYHWPTTSIVPPVTTLVNARNFTFTSPSVYVAFQTLVATNMCGVVGANDTIDTTLAFSSNELLTAPVYTTNTDSYLPLMGRVFTAASWRDASDCAAITESFYQNIFDVPNTYDTVPASWLTSGSVEADFPLYTVSYNPCSPLISIPTQLYPLDKAWTDCAPAIDISFFDPPSILTPGTGLFAATDTRAANQITTTTSAQPHPTPASNIATMTSALVTPKITSSSDLPASLPINDPAPSSSPSNDPPTQTTLSNANDPTPSDPPSEDPATQTTSSDANNPPSPSYTISTAPNNASPSPNVLTPAIITLGSSTITANTASAFILPDSQTLNPGSQLTYSSTILSLASNGASLVIQGSTTQNLIPSSSEYLVGTQTLIAGAPAITVSGTTLSLQLNGASVVIDGSTQPMASLLSSTNAEYIVGSQTLQPGGAAITVSGTAVSLLAGGSSVVVGGSKTEALSEFLGPSTTETEGGIGGMIATIGGFVDPNPSTQSSAYLQATGKGGGYNGTIFWGGVERTVLGRQLWCVGIIVSVGVGWIL